MKPTISKDPEIIDRLLSRAVENILPSKEYLKKRLLSGERLNIYQGFDPTGETLHIGHTVGMRKLRDFQLLGHNVTFLIGDFTARIGDPSDKSAARKKLTKEEVVKNMKDYINQASRILDFNLKSNPINVRYNSEWLEKQNFADIIELASVFTVQQMLKRDMFQKRLENDKPIYIHEFMYPMMQAYDAYAMDTDVEVGGNDQTFNMLCGRDLEVKWLNKEKVVLSTKLLTDPEGKKMGKTEGNMIMLADTPQDMYGKVMAFPDSLIVPAYELLTDTPMGEIKQIEDDMKSGKLNPIDAKKKLAFIITAIFKGDDEADKAQKYFEEVFQQKGGDDLSGVEVIKVGDKPIRITDLIVKNAKFISSNSEAKRLVEHGAVSIDGIKITDKMYEFVASKKEAVLRAGRKVVKVTI